MRNRATLASVLALSLCAQAADAGTASAKDRLQRIAQQKINALRAETGAPKLHRTRTLNRSASSYARYMLRRSYFGHLPRIRASTSEYRSLGEIILMHRGGHGRPRVAVRNWARSPGHRSVMLSPTYRRVGIGKASGTFDGHRVTIWVAHVGRRW
jgi:uncharacterized protein YkwD